MTGMALFPVWFLPMSARVAVVVSDASSIFQHSAKCDDSDQAVQIVSIFVDIQNEDSFPFVWH